MSALHNAIDKIRVPQIGGLIRREVRDLEAEIERLGAEIALANRWAAYCRSCALCGEMPHDRKRFDAMESNQSLAAEAKGRNAAGGE